MSTLTLDTFLPVVLSSAGKAGVRAQENSIASGVRQVLAAAQPRRTGSERRREARHPYPLPVHLTPLDEAGKSCVHRTFVVIGKHLCDHGLDFYCSLPLPDRRVIASLDGGDAGWIGLVLELAWCRFSRHGWYDNGGRFIAVVPSPLAGVMDGKNCVA